ncbi:MAG: proline racemase family protein [Solitalea sp.]
MHIHAVFEPRGHDLVSGSILYPPHRKENDLAVLFIETSPYMHGFQVL